MQNINIFKSTVLKIINILRNNYNAHYEFCFKSKNLTKSLIKKLIKKIYNF